MCGGEVGVENQNDMFFYENKCSVNTRKTRVIKLWSRQRQLTPHEELRHQINIIFDQVETVQYIG